MFFFFFFFEDFDLLLYGRFWLNCLNVQSEPLKAFMKSSSYISFQKLLAKLNKKNMLEAFARTFCSSWHRLMMIQVLLLEASNKVLGYASDIEKKCYWIAKFSFLCENQSSLLLFWTQLLKYIQLWICIWKAQLLAYILYSSEEASLSLSELEI